MKSGTIARELFCPFQRNRLSPETTETLRVQSYCAWCKAQMPWPITNVRFWTNYDEQGNIYVGPQYVECPRCGQKYAIEENDPQP